jgi:gliding motility-associated-like protein
MIKRLFILLSYLLLSYAATSQNLIPNGDFENCWNLPYDFGQCNRATGWNNVNGHYTMAPYGSPDYYRVNGFDNVGLGLIPPYSGSGQMGFVAFDSIFPNYREYISTKLNTNLIVGQQYQVSFYLTNGDGINYTVPISGLGMHFSIDSLTQSFAEPILVAPQIEISNITYIVNTWQPYSFIITATNPFRYITIGLFKDDAHITHSIFGKHGAYYFIDKIEMVPYCPNFGVTGDSVICSGDSALITAFGSSSFAWVDSLNPSTFISNQSSIWVSPTNTTTYLVSGDSNTLSFTVNVYPRISLDLGNDTTLCQGEILTLNATNTYATYLWQDLSTNSTYTVTQPGTYWVGATNNCETKYDTITVHYDSLFAVDLGNDTILCQGELLLNATTANASYTWQDNSTNPTYNVTQSGTYWVRTTKSCSVTDTITVNFISFPILNFGNDTILCPNETLILDATNPGASYLWQDNSTNATFTVSQPGTYWVATTNNCGIIKDTINVTYYPLYIIDLGSDTTLCEGKSMILEATTPNASYLWQDNATTSNYTVSLPGIYWVNVVTNCRISDTITVNYIPLPRANFGSDTTLCQGKTLQLEPTPNSFYLWQDGSQNPSFTITEAGTYWVNVSNSCGVANDTISVDFKDCYCTLFIPNAFRPNNDNLNDRFAPVSTCDFTEYHFLVFNRWGQIVYETYNPTDSWDGNCNGNPASLGLYVYLVIYKFGNEIISNTNYGNVNLFR